MDINNIERVIVFRSARLEEIFTRLNDPKLSGLASKEALVIAQHGVAKNDLKAVFQRCEVAYLPTGMYSLFNTSFKLFRRLKAFKADLFLITYNNDLRKGYRQIEALGLLLSGPKVIGINKVGKLINITKMTVVLDFLKDRIDDIIRPGSVTKMAIDVIVNLLRKLPSPQSIVNLFPGLFYRFPFYHIFPKLVYPKRVWLYLENRCNINCFFCAVDSFEGHSLKLETVKKLKTAIKYTDTVALGGLGEPLLYKNLEELLAYIYSINPKDNLIHLVTNGTVLSKELPQLFKGHLQSLHISLNATNPETYRKDMQYDFAKTLQKIREFMSCMDAADHKKVRLQFVVHKKNFSEMPDFVSLAKDLGITAVSFSLLRVVKKEHFRLSILHVKKEYNTALDKARKRGDDLGVCVTGSARKFFEEDPSSPAFNTSNCAIPFNDCIVAENGNIEVCCLLGGLTFGNVSDGFESVWFSQKLNELRKKRFPSLCQTCPDFLPFDDYRGHLSYYLKEGDEYKSFATDAQDVGVKEPS